MSESDYAAYEPRLDLLTEIRRAIWNNLYLSIDHVAEFERLVKSAGIDPEEVRPK